jgi:hypothetical protein
MCYYRDACTLITETGAFIKHAWVLTSDDKNAGGPDGKALLQRLWESAQSSPHSEAPLALWLLWGALRPWFAAARLWAFSSAPSAPMVRHGLDSKQS